MYSKHGSVFSCSREHSSFNFGGDITSGKIKIAYLIEFKISFFVLNLINFMDAEIQFWPTSKFCSYFEISFSFPVITSEIVPCSKHMHTCTFPFLIVLFMYLRVPGITVYPVCTQPADLMSPVFIYLWLLGKEEVWSQSNHAPIDGHWVHGGSSLHATVCIREVHWRAKTTMCHSYLEAVRLDL